MSAVGVGSRHDQRGHAHDIGRQTGCDQLLDCLHGRHQDFAAQMSALFGGGELVLEVHAGGAGFDHGLHQFESIQVAAETGFGVGDQRSEPVDAILAFGMMNLIRACQGLIDAAAKIGDAVGRIKALVGIHLAGIIGIGRDLPAADVDSFQSGINLLHGLVAGHGAERWHIRFALYAI